MSKQLQHYYLKNSYTTSSNVAFVYGISSATNIILLLIFEEVSASTLEKTIAV